MYIKVFNIFKSLFKLTFNLKNLEQIINQELKCELQFEELNIPKCRVK